MDQALIDHVVARVVALVRARMIADAPRREIVMLFSGASTGYVVGMEALRLLSDAQHKLTVGMTASALHVIGEDKVRQAGAGDIIGPNQWVNAPGLVWSTDLLLLPTLSMNTAAHLALGLMDSLFSTLVLGALLAGKPVIAVCDGADPNGNGGRVFSKNNTGSPALRRTMLGHLDTLRDYGVQLVREGEFVPAVIRQLQGGDPVAPSKPAIATLATNGTAALAISPNGRPAIITEGELAAIDPGTILHLPYGARLTPLAHDTAQRRGLRLVWEE